MSDKKKEAINLGDIFSQLPDMFVQQFARLACYYLGYINSPTKELDRTDYVNESCNAINILTKLVALSSNGTDINGKVSLDSLSIVSLDKAINYYKSYAGVPPISETTTDSEAVNEQPKKKAARTTVSPKDPKEIMESELKLWGIDESTYAYKAISDIPYVCTSEMTPKEAINAIAKNNGKNAGVTANASKRAVANAAFENSKHFHIFKTLDPSVIDKDFFIKTVIAIICK